MRRQRVRIVSEWSDVVGRAVHARVAGRRTGTEPQIVLVHGLGMSSRYMKPLLRHLAPHAYVLAVDLPGYGLTRAPGRLTLPELAESLAAWMDSRGLDRAVLVGNSLGAQVIAHLAILHPERIHRVVLVGATRDPAAGGTIQHMLRLVLDATRERPSLLLVGGIDYLRAGPVKMIQLFAEARRTREEWQLVQLRVPTLVVRGERDPVSTQAWNEQIITLVPNSRLVVIPGAAHAVNFSAPGLLAGEIVRFLTDPAPAATNPAPINPAPTDSRSAGGVAQSV